MHKLELSGQAGRRDPLPPLEALRVFEAAARHLSFTRAAEELFVTQSAVSKQVQVLESALGVRLFERLTRALALTPAGERLARASASALAVLREVSAQIRAGDEPVVTLATTPAFATFWLIPRLADFRRRYPGIDIRLSADTRVIDLERGGFDVAVRYLQDGPVVSQAVRLFGETVVAVASPALLRQPGKLLRAPADLAHHILLAYESDFSLTPWLTWPVWLEMAGVPDLRPAGSIGFNRYEAAIRAAVDGQGVALAAQALVGGLLQSGELVVPLPQQFSHPRAYFLLTANRAAQNPAVEPFRRWLVEQAGNASPA